MTCVRVCVGCLVGVCERMSCSVGAVHDVATTHVRLAMPPQQNRRNMFVRTNTAVVGPMVRSGLHKHQ